MKKGQFALEFVILFSFAILFSAIFLSVIEKSYVESQKIQQEEQINQVMRIISSEVTLAELSPPGYERTFYIPTLIEGVEYNISSSDDVDMIFEYNNEQYVFFLSKYNTTQSTALEGACSCLKPGYNKIRHYCRPSPFGNVFCSIVLVNPETGDNCIHYSPSSQECDSNS